MKNLNELLDSAKERTGSDYKTALAIGVSRQYISKARKGDGFSDDAALALAELLDIDPIKVIATVNVERTKSPAMKARWERYAQASVIAIVLITGSFPGTVTATLSSATAQALYIMLSPREVSASVPSGRRSRPSGNQTGTSDSKLRLS